MFLEANSFCDIWHENYFENVFITLNFNLKKDKKELVNLEFCFL